MSLVLSLTVLAALADPTGYALRGRTVFTGNPEQAFIHNGIVLVRDGKVETTDGPFAETKEQLGGYYLLDCKDLDEALELAAKIPSAKAGSIEVRPVMVFE